MTANDLQYVDFNYAICEGIWAIMDLTIKYGHKKPLIYLKSEPGDVWVCAVYHFKDILGVRILLFTPLL